MEKLINIQFRDIIKGFGKVKGDVRRNWRKVWDKFGEVGREEDHIHCLFKANLTTALAKFINAYKSTSSRIVMEGAFFGPEVIVC